MLCLKLEVGGRVHGAEDIRCTTLPLSPNQTRALQQATDFVSINITATSASTRGMSTALSAALCVLALLATPLCRSYTTASPVPPVLTHQQDEDDTIDESAQKEFARIQQYILQDQTDKFLAEAQRDSLRRFFNSLPTQQQQQVQPLQQQAQQFQQPFALLSSKQNLFAPESEPLDDKEKRGSYMSLCHFKICNMGRKRNLRTVNPWIRQ